MSAGNGHFLVDPGHIFSCLAVLREEAMNRHSHINRQFADACRGAGLSVGSGTASQALGGGASEGESSLACTSASAEAGFRGGSADSVSRAGGSGLACACVWQQCPEKRRFLVLDRGRNFG